MKRSYPDAPDFEWLDPWAGIDSPGEAAGVEHELYREMPPGHLLYGVECIALGRRHDDILFRIPDGRVAFIHLTWHKETDPTWPYAMIIPSLEEFSRTIMTPTHVEMKED